MIRGIVRLSFNPTFCHVSPPSVVRYTPSPHPDEFRSLASPVPTQMTSESAGATASVPIESIGCLSKIGWNVTPLSLVLKTPPCPRPTQNTSCHQGATIAFHLCRASASLSFVVSCSQSQMRQQVGALSSDWRGRQ